MNSATIQLLRSLADRYETPDFLSGDPSWFMHQVRTEADAELMGFVASCFSYGQRAQFMPRIERILRLSEGETARWIAAGDYRKDIKDDAMCFYRLSTNADLLHLLDAMKRLLADYGSMKSFVSRNASTGFEAISALTRYFAEAGIHQIVPCSTQSACKRLAMFLRWMVRRDSPVDLGLWADVIPRKTLIMPLDTHVLQEAGRLGLINSRNATMTTAQRLTETMLEAFPDDPVRGDFALFGLGVDNETTLKNKANQ